MYQLNANRLSTPRGLGFIGSLTGKGTEHCQFKQVDFDAIAGSTHNLTALLNTLWYLAAPANKHIKAVHLPSNFVRVTPYKEAWWKTNANLLKSIGMYARRFGIRLSIDAPYISTVETLRNYVRLGQEFGFHGHTKTRTDSWTIVCESWERIHNVLREYPGQIAVRNDHHGIANVLNMRCRVLLDLHAHHACEGQWLRVNSKTFEAIRKTWNGIDPLVRVKLTDLKLQPKLAREYSYHSTVLLNSYVNAKRLPYIWRQNGEQV